MHRVVQDQIEKLMAQQRNEPHLRAGNSAAASAHLAECAECREELQTMQQHAQMLRQLRPPQGFEAEPRAGFYARVMERIEAEGPVSIWNLFMESPFGRRIAVASLAFVIVLGVYLVSSEHEAEDPIITQSTGAQSTGAQSPVPGVTGIRAEFTQPVADFSQIDLFSGDGSDAQQRLPITDASFAAPADDAVLSNLMTYREQ